MRPRIKSIDEKIINKYKQLHGPQWFKKMNEYRKLTVEMQRLEAMPLQPTQA